MKTSDPDSMPLLDFILQGKISGYASGGEGQEKSFNHYHGGKLSVPEPTA